MVQTNKKQWILQFLTTSDGHKSKPTLNSLWWVNSIINERIWIESKPIRNKENDSK